MRKQLLFLFCLVFTTSLVISQTDPVLPTIPSVPANPTFEANGVYYLNQDTVVSVGDNGMVWRSIDGGFTYSAISTFTRTKNNNSVIMMNNYICIAGDSGTVTFSGNRGATWANSVQAQPLINYHDVNFADTTFGVSVGDQGDAVLYKWVGGLGWTHIATGLTQRLNAVVAFKASASVFTDGEALAAGDDGVLSHYQFGSWTNSQAPVTTDINDMYLFPDHSTVIAVGDSGLILRSTDFGVNWTIIQSGMNENLNGVSEGVNPSEIYAVGDSGVIYVSTDAGLSFARYSIGFTTSNLKSVSARTPRGAFAGSGNTLRTMVMDTITVSSVSGFAACPSSDTVEVVFDFGGQFGANNMFILELSDASGSFTSPVSLDTIIADSDPDTIAVIMPSVPAGTAYRVRIAGTEPMIYSDDNGTDLIVYSLPAQPSILLGANTTQLYTPSVAGLTYQWYYNGNAMVGETDTIITTTGNGDYMIVATNANGCLNYSNDYNYTLTSIDKVVPVSTKFTVAPNPTDGIIYLSNPSALLNKTLKVYNVIGDEVYSTKVTGSKQMIDLHELNNGVYFIKIDNQINRFIKN